MTDKKPIDEQIAEFSPEKDNPCWECPHRAYSKYDWMNVCLLDEDAVCNTKEGIGMTEAKDIPNPGSDEAVKQGCVCPVLDNQHGKGAFDFPDGHFYINEGCPLHWEGRKEE